MMPGLAAYELGIWHALDGRAPLTDPTTIARYAATHGRNPEPLEGHIAVVMYEGGFRQGSEDPEMKLPPDGHDYLVALDRMAAG